MPAIGWLHPVVVHFAIALTIFGVVFRMVGLWPRVAWLGTVAPVLIFSGAVACLIAVTSGVGAHGPVERIPGVRDAVVAHEWWGIWARNLVLVVAALEVVALVMRRHPRVRTLQVASAVVGALAIVTVWQSASLGGRLVYSYAGGIGIRNGDPADVQRLLLAGLYQQAQVDRQQGRHDASFALITQAAALQPENLELKLAAAEAVLVDRRDAHGAVAALQQIEVPADNARLQVRHGLITADALEAAGQREGARALLQSLLATYPTNARLQQRLDALK